MNDCKSHRRGQHRFIAPNGEVGSTWHADLTGVSPRAEGALGPLDDRPEKCLSEPTGELVGVDRALGPPNARRYNDQSLACFRICSNTSSEKDNACYSNEIEHGKGKKEDNLISC